MLLALVLTGAAQLAAPVAAAPPAAERALVFAEAVSDAVEGYQFSVIEHAFAFTNRGPVTGRPAPAGSPAPAER